MYTTNELIKALSECIQEMNTGLIEDDNIQNCISLIQIKTALLEMADIINDNQLISTQDELKKIREYVDICMSVLNIYHHISEIGDEIYKEDYLSEETCLVIMNKFDYVFRRMSSILENKNISSMLVSFIEYVTDRINKYYSRVNDIMKKGHIK